MHWESNAKHSPDIIRKITNDVCIGNVVFGGDAINGQANQDVAREYFNTIASGLSNGKSPFVAVFGNHDNNANDGGTEFANIDKTFSALFQKKNDYRVGDYTGEAYFYFDNKATNTRHIILNTRNGNDLSYVSGQVTWLESLLDNAPNDMHIIIYMHIYCTGTAVRIDGAFAGYDYGVANSGSSLDDILSSRTSKKVEFIIAGHTHVDYNGCNPQMIPVIVTDCDARQSQMWSYALGTINEQSFDIVVADFGNKKICCRRIGRGKSRIVHYSPYTLSINDTLDISSLLEIVPTNYSIRDNFSFQYRNATGGGTGVTFNSTLASISSNGVVTAVASGIITAVAENDNCIETFNIKIE